MPEKRCRNTRKDGRRDLCDRLLFVVRDGVLEIKCERCGGIQRFDLVQLLLESELASGREPPAGAASAEGLKPA